MRQIHISLPARRDLDAIWAYSVDQWAEIRADDYIRAIHAAMQLALGDPEIGSAVEIRLAFRKLPAGSHHIYYQKIKDGIRIIRVLQQSMDTRRHL